MVAMRGSDGYDAASLTTHYRQQPRASRRGSQARVAQKLERWMFLYNVTTGLYMLDLWERCIFNAVFLVFFLLACYNSGHYLCRLGAGLLAWCGDDAAPSFAFGRGFVKGCSVVMELGVGG